MAENSIFITSYNGFASYHNSQNPHPDDDDWDDDDFYWNMTETMQQKSRNRRDGGWP